MAALPWWPGSFCAAGQPVGSSSLDLRVPPASTACDGADDAPAVGRGEAKRPLSGGLVKRCQHQCGGRDVQPARPDGLSFPRHCTCRWGGSPLQRPGSEATITPRAGFPMGSLVVPGVNVTRARPHGDSERCHHRERAAAQGTKRLFVFSLKLLLAAALLGAKSPDVLLPGLCTLPRGAPGGPHCLPS